MNTLKNKKFNMNTIPHDSGASPSEVSPKLTMSDWLKRMSRKQSVQCTDASTITAKKDVGLHPIYRYECDKRGILPETLLANTTITEEEGRSKLYFNGSSSYRVYLPDGTPDPNAPKQTGKPGEGRCVWSPKSPISDKYIERFNKVSLVVEGEMGALVLCPYFKFIKSIGGVQNWKYPKKHARGGELKDEIARDIPYGQTIVYSPDGDVHTNRDVWEQCVLFGKAVVDKGGKFKIVTTGVPKKGLDDLFKEDGIDAVVALLDKCYTLESFIEEVPQPGRTIGKSSVDGRRGKLTEMAAADAYARELEKTISYDSILKVWRAYGYKVVGAWSEIPEEEVCRLLVNTSIEGADISTDAKVKNILRALQYKLPYHDWNEGVMGDIVPYLNGALNVKTLELKPHSPDNYLTYVLPRKYDPSANDWGLIDSFLMECVEGRIADYHALLAFMAHVLRPIPGIQKYLHLIGKPGSGKGTFTNLLMALIGENNASSSSLQRFNNNNFEPATALNKRLLTFPDEQGYSGDAQQFLNATGGEYLPFERKGKDRTQFRYPGAVLMTSNAPVFHGENLKAVGRRQKMISFNAQPKPDTELLDKLISQLPALENYLLSMTPEEIKGHLYSKSDDGKVVEWESRIQSDTIADWVNTCLVQASSDCYTRMDDTKDDEQLDYLNAKSLYRSYTIYCKHHGGTAKKMAKFSPDLIGLLEDIGWQVKKGKNRLGAVLYGVRIRVEGETVLTHDERLRQQQKCDDLEENVTTCDDLCDDLKPLPHKDGDDCDGFFALPTEKSGIVNESKNTTFYSPTPKKPSHPSQPIQSKDLNPSHNPSQTHHTQQPITATPTTEQWSPFDEVDEKAVGLTLEEKYLQSLIPSPEQKEKWWKQNEVEYKVGDIVELTSDHSRLSKGARCEVKVVEPGSYLVEGIRPSFLKQGKQKDEPVPVWVNPCMIKRIETN